MFFILSSSPQIRMRDDGLPLAHIAIAVEGASAASPDIVPLMVANSIIGSFDLTYGGGKVGEMLQHCALVYTVKNRQVRNEVELPPHLDSALSPLSFAHLRFLMS